MSGEGGSADDPAAGLACSDARFQRMSFDVLHDLGMSEKSILAYLDRFGRLGARAARSDPARRRAEPGEDEACFGGGYWRWGVRAHKSDFW